MRRSMLFIPGNNPKMMINCGYLPTDSIIFDLEDAVSPAEKDTARILVRNAVNAIDLSGIEVIIRINSVDTDYWQKDLDTVTACRPSLIMLPKSSSAGDIERVSLYLSICELKNGLSVGSIGILPLIETALGVENAFQIASASPRVKAIFLGAEDLSADLRCKRTKEGTEILYARGRLVNAARAAGVDVYDTPFTDVEDDEGMLADAKLAKSLGFTGKAAINPRHVGVINEVFSPTEAEIAYAHEVMDAITEAKAKGLGAIALHGKMIDAPIVARAEQTLGAAEQLAKRGGM